jgi:methyl-accepting chemotaxis protein
MPLDISRFNSPSNPLDASTRWLPTALTVLGVIVIALGSWRGGAAGCAMSTSAGMVLGWCIQRTSRQRASGEADTTLPRHAGGLPQLVQRVVPMWLQQVNLSREQCKGGVEKLLTSFSTLSDLMSTLAARLDNFTPGTAPGAIGEALDTERDAMDALMAPVKRAFAQRDAMVSQVTTCADAMASLQFLSKEIRDIAQHTRLVAFNASIESVRGQQGTAGGSQSVAIEIRRLSERIMQVCDQLDERLQPLHQASHEARRQALIHDTTDHELQLELDLRAREAIQKLLSSLGSKLGSGHELHECSHALVAQMDAMFMHFQFGDRVDQMLQIICEDMDRMVDASGNEAKITRQDIQSWMDGLAGRYTTDEQRAQHHGTELVDQGSQVEFF